MNIHSKIEVVQCLIRSKRIFSKRCSNCLLIERSYDGTTVPMIAQKAKVGAGTIYRYFANKKSLVNSLFIECVLQFSYVLKTDFPSDSTIREQATHIFFSYLNLPN